jgi:hypothetical protein
LLRKAAAESSAGVSSATTSPASAVLQAGDEQLLPACEQIVLHLKRFYPLPNAVPLPRDEVLRWLGASVSHNGAESQVLIVPNPVQTHLPLVFDRLIDAVQQCGAGFGIQLRRNSTKKSDPAQSEAQQWADLTAEMDQIASPVLGTV